MKLKYFFLLDAILCLSLLPHAAAQKFQPKTIQFKGDPEYSDQELMAAAGLKKGMVLDFSEMKGHSQKLMDSGVFDTLGFKFDGEDLVYTLVPASQLFPVRLENLPLTPGKDLDAALHQRLPLYHGKVPAAGGINEQVRQALQDMLAAKGIKTTVSMTPYTDEALQQVTAMSYSISAPPVLVGTIQPDAASAALDAGAQGILSKLTGSVYDIQGSPSQIEAELGDYYRDQGYVAAEVHAIPAGSPVVAADGIHVPFQVSVTPGAIYRIAGIQLAPGLLVSQADFDHQSGIQPGTIATGKYVRGNWEFIARQYHGHGYMKAVVHPAPSLDRAKSTVSYTVTVDPGPMYTMGRLTIENVSDDLQARMIAAWKLDAGAPFNEGAISSYFMNNSDPGLRRLFASVNCKYTLTMIDSIHRVNVTLRLERKQ